MCSAMTAIVIGCVDRQVVADVLRVARGMSVATVGTRSTGASARSPWYRSRRLAAGSALASLQSSLLSSPCRQPRGRLIDGRSRGTSSRPTRSTTSSRGFARNRNTNSVLANVLRPIGDFVIAFYESLRDLLLDLPWFWLPLMVLLCIARSGRWLAAVGASGRLFFIEVAGLHEPGMETIALMLICVVLSVAIGAPLGIWAGLNPKVERRMRPVLDALQSIPTTVYLVLRGLFFGIKQTPAAIATVIFAIPPMIRITALGHPPGARRHRWRRATCSARATGSCCGRCRLPRRSSRLSPPSTKRS